MSKVTEFQTHKKNAGGLNFSEGNIREYSFSRADWEPAVEKTPCVLLCFIKPILGNRYGPGVSSRASQGSTNKRWRIAHAPPDLPPFFFESTQLARQLHQERTQMKVCVCVALFYY